MGAESHQSNPDAANNAILDEPSMFRVILLNDDYTTMDFVVMILMQVFHKSEPEAEQIMLSVHQTGRGVCGVYVYSVAETKVKVVECLAEKAKFPLRCVLEEV